MQQPNDIKKFWDEQAEKHGADCEATTPDRFLRELEVKAIGEWLPQTGRILDIGCGNAWSTIRWKEMRPQCDFYAVDFSEKMIDAIPKDVRSIINCRVGDVLNLPFDDGSFDCVITDRCLINLTTVEDQKKAINEIARVLRRRGTYAMCENWAHGLNILNTYRAMVGLDEIPVRWHNRYLKYEDMNTVLYENYEVSDPIYFGSTYYVASRIFNARLAKDAGVEPDHHARINEIAAQLPPIGEIGPMKLMVLRKR